MGNVIQIKRGATDAVTDAILQPGELALDTDTGYLYYGTSGGTSSSKKELWIGVNSVKAQDTSSSGKLAYFITVAQVPQLGTFLTTCNLTVGATNKPIYINAGVPSACSDDIGSASKPIYSDGGVLKACSSTVGGTANPVYLNAGDITACSSTVGSTTKPVYLDAGTITACSSTVGATNRPIYSNAGTLTNCTYYLKATLNAGSAASRLAYYSGTTAVSSYNSTTGSSSLPIYLNAGVPTAISSLTLTLTEGSFWQSRDLACIRTNISSWGTTKWRPSISMKGKACDWSMGFYDTSGAIFRDGESLLFAYTPDSSYSGETNPSPTVGVSFSRYYGIHSVGTNFGFRHVHPTTNNEMCFGFSTSGANGGVYDSTAGRWLVYTTSSDTLRRLRTTLPMASAADSEKAKYVPVSNLIYIMKYVATSSQTYVELTLDGVSAKGITVWNSDIRLKKNIKNTELKALPIINAIQHYKFDWKEEKTSSVPLGYIAQQIEEVIPGSTFATGEEKYLNIAPGDIIPYLSKAIQELSEKVDNLEKRITELGG